MKDSVRTKLENLDERYQEISALLSEGDIIADQKKFRSLSQEYAEIEDVVMCFKLYNEAKATNSDAKAMLDEDDPEMRELAQEELKSSSRRIQELETELQTLMLPKDIRDNCNVFLEIRAGTGGDEAAIFSGD